jgi:uncharacterized membrane protein
MSLNPPASPMSVQIHQSLSSMIPIPYVTLLPSLCSLLIAWLICCILPIHGFFVVKLAWFVGCIGLCLFTQSHVFRLAAERAIVHRHHS